MSDFPLSPRQQDVLRRLIEAHYKSRKQQESFHYRENMTRGDRVAILLHSGWPKDSEPVFLRDLDVLARGGYIDRWPQEPGWDFDLAPTVLEHHESLKSHADEKSGASTAEPPPALFSTPAEPSPSEVNTESVHQHAVIVENKPRVIYCSATTSEGTESLDKAEYNRLVGTRSEYDMFLDGITREASYRDGENKLHAKKLAAKELAILSEYIQTGKRMRPVQTKTGKLCQDSVAARRLFIRARRKVDVALHGRHAYRAFHLHQDPVDSSLNSYQFRPPQDLSYCLILPI